MTFSIFLPPQALKSGARVPVVYYLSGLTCTDDNVTQKACVQRSAATHGLAIVMPDTSPRGAGIEGEDDSYDFGSRVGITGHSMGGHGALTIALRNPAMFRSVSAFAPICNPTKCPWGEKAFTGYLGSVDAGKEHDATELMRSRGPFPGYADILIDQGSADNFL